MALILYPTDGYDSFITTAQATDVIAKYTLDSAVWVALSELDKEAYLRISFKLIENGLPLMPETITTCLVQAQSLIAISDVVNKFSKPENTLGAVKKSKVGVIEEQYYEPKPTMVKYRIPDMVMPCLLDLGWVNTQDVSGISRVSLIRS